MKLERTQVTDPTLGTFNWCKFSATHNDKRGFKCIFSECATIFRKREDALHHVNKFDLEQHIRFGLVKPSNKFRRLFIGDTPPQEDHDLATIMGQSEAEMSQNFYAKFEECTRKLKETSVGEVDVSSSSSEDGEDDDEDDHTGDMQIDTSQVDAFFDDSAILEDFEGLKNLMETEPSCFNSILQAPLRGSYLHGKYGKYSKEELRKMKWMDIYDEASVGGITIKTSDQLKLEKTSDNSSNKTEERPCCSYSSSSSSSSNCPSTSSSSVGGRSLGLLQLLDAGYNVGCSSSDKPIKLDNITLESMLESSAKIVGRGRIPSRRNWKTLPKLPEREMAKHRRVVHREKKARAELEEKQRMEMGQDKDEIMQPTEESCSAETKRRVKIETEEDKEKEDVPVVRSTVAPPPISAAPVAPRSTFVAPVVTPPSISVAPVAPHQEGPLYYSYSFIYETGLKNKPKFAQSGNQKPYHCPVPDCPKTYKNANGLKYHAINAHNPPQIYKCDQCSKLYQTKSSLDKHIKAHTQPPRAVPANSSRSGKLHPPAPKRKAVAVTPTTSQPSDTESETEVDHGTKEQQQVQQTIVPPQPQPTVTPIVTPMPAWESPSASSSSSSSSSGLSQFENYPYFHQQHFGQRPPPQQQQHSSGSLYSSSCGGDSIKTPDHREVEELRAIPTSSPISFDLDFDPSLLSNEVLEDSNDSSDVGAAFQDSMLYPSMPKLELVMHTPRKAAPQYERTYGLPPQLKRKDRSSAPMTASQMYFHERAGPQSNMYYQN